MDYAQLNLGRAASIIIDLSLLHLGQSVCLSCIYDPLGEAKRYHLTFHDCRAVTLHTFEAHTEASAELIGMTLGQANHHTPACINTDMFELTMTYGDFILEKQW